MVSVMTCEVTCCSKASSPDGPTVVAAQEQIAKNATAQHNSDQREVQPLMGVSTIQTAPTDQTAHGQDPPTYYDQIYYPALAKAYSGF